VLTELLMAGLIASFLMLGLVQMAASTSRGLLLIESLSESQQGGRFAIEQIRGVVMAAGYDPAPWEDASTLVGLSENSLDGGTNGSDVLTVRELSDRNCYDTLNTVRDGDGRPTFYLRESTFERSAGGNLARTCYYGPEGGVMVRQINREGLVRGVESFQVLYAEDTDADLRVDRRVRAGHWNNTHNVLGVQGALLLATEEPVGDLQSTPLMVLDQAVTPPQDGRLRRVWATTIPLGSKLR
jgi:hypothetical protein